MAPAPASPSATRPGAGRWHRRLRHSLKGRLVLLFLALALGSTLLFVSASRELFSTGWRELARPLLADYLDRLAAEIGSPPDLARAQALVRRLPLAIRIDGPTLHWASHPERAGQGPHDDGLRRMLSRRTADGHEIRFGLGDWQWDERPRGFGWFTLLGLLGLTAAAYAYVRRLLRPLDDIGAGVRRYGGGDFAQPIALRRHDELGDLATQVNAMAASLSRMLEGQRGLLLAISHELRSPLTRARLHAELLADSAGRDALLRDLGLMRDLIADLLESERLAAGAAVLRRAPTDLNALVHALVAAQFAGRDIVLALQADLPRWPLDAARMQLLVRNLLDNALRHGGGSAVLLATREVDGGLQLTVRDHGPGVDEAQLARLAEAFYRPDAARTRSAGGVGLGLYLCRLVAQSHGGTLRLRNAAPGLEAIVQLPPDAAAGA
jgi:signal transduction histidine kinase